MKKKTYNTTGRTALLEYLSSHADRQFSVEELCIALHGNAQSGKSSLYRQLSSLCDCHAVRKCRHTESGRNLFQYVDVSCERHLHETCVRCGKVEHLDCHVSAEFFEHLLKEHGFQVYYGQSMLYGLCADCRRGGQDHA